MSDVDHALPHPSVPDLPRTAGWPSRVVRGCAIAVLVLAGLTVVTSVMPASRSIDALSADLAAGRVSHIEYSPGSRVVRWVVDWVRWRQAPLELPEGGTTEAPDPGQDEAWLRRQIGASGHPVAVTYRDADSSGPWAFDVQWAPLRYAAGGTWLLTLAHMLSRGGHRVANRWA
jgi:hypothetical protein